MDTIKACRASTKGIVAGLAITAEQASTATESASTTELEVATTITELASPTELEVASITEASSAEQASTTTEASSAEQASITEASGAEQASITTDASSTEQASSAIEVSTTKRSLRRLTASSGHGCVWLHWYVGLTSRKTQAVLFEGDTVGSIARQNIRCLGHGRHLEILLGRHLGVFLGGSGIRLGVLVGTRLGTLGSKERIWVCLQ